MSNNETPDDSVVIPEETDPIDPTIQDPPDSIAVTQEENSIAPEEEEEIMFEEPVPKSPSVNMFSPRFPEQN